MKLSVVVPIYNERETISNVCERIQSVDIDKKIVLVDDCSTDGTQEIIRGFASVTLFSRSLRMHHFRVCTAGLLRKL